MRGQFRKSLGDLKPWRGSDEAAGVWECVSQRSRVSLVPRQEPAAKWKAQKTTARVWEPSSLDCGFLCPGQGSLTTLLYAVGASWRAKDDRWLGPIPLLFLNKRQETQVSVDPHAVTPKNGPIFGNLLANLSDSCLVAAEEVRDVNSSIIKK